MKNGNMSLMPETLPPIPTRADWGNLDDLDVQYGFNLYGGKSIAEALPFFSGVAAMSRDELHFAPWPVFQYYVFGFVQYLTSPQSKGDSDAASVFLNLVLQKAKTEPQHFWEMYPRLKPIVDYVSGRHLFYGADADIYDFHGRRRAIRAAVEAAKHRPGV